MITWLRWSLAAVALAAVAALVPLGAMGLWAQTALTDAEGFSDRMEEAWQVPAVRTEVREQARTYIFTELSQLSFGPFTTLFRDQAQQFADDALTDVLASEQFADGWSALSTSIFVALTSQSDDAAVTIDVAPVLEPLLADTLNGALGQFIGDIDIPLQVEVNAEIEDITATMESLQWLADNASGLLLGALAAASIALAVAPRRWWAATALAAAAAVGAVGTLVWIEQSTAAAAVDSGTPNLTGAVTDALLAGLPEQLTTIALVSALAAAALGTTAWLHQRRTASLRSAAGTATA